MCLRRLILAVPVLLLLGGCAGLAETAIGLPSGILTKSIENPVTKNDLRRAESVIRVSAAALQAYKNYCETRPVGDRCDAVVQTLQSYSTRSRPLIRQLRTFVQKNDQVNAGVVFNTLRGIFQEFQLTAKQEGIPLPQLVVN